MPSFTASAAFCCFLTIFAALTYAPRARGDVAVIVPPQVERDAGSEIAEQAVEELARLLKVAGFDVVSPGQAAAAAEVEQQRGVFSREFDPLYCLTPECANEYRKLFDATFAVQLKLLGKGVRSSNLTVVLTEQPEVFFAATAPVEGRDVRSAVRNAFEAARAKQIDGAGPWLSIEGTPVGALVYLDGMEFGHVPFTKRHVKAGVHRLEVRAPGYATKILSIEVPDVIDHTARARFELTHAAASGSQESDETSEHARFARRSAWDYVVGTGLLAAGAAHLIAGSYQKSKSGDCATSELGRCVERYGDTRGVAREHVLIGVGAAGVFVGTLVLGIGPLGRLQARTGRDHAILTWTREF